MFKLFLFFSVKVSLQLYTVLYIIFCLYNGISTTWIPWGRHTEQKDKIHIKWIYKELHATSGHVLLPKKVWCQSYEKNKTTLFFSALLISEL